MVGKDKIMVTIEELEKYWEEHSEIFETIVDNVEYQNKGIWYTEAFLFTSVCSLLGVEVIVESGVASGCSTDIFASCFDGPVISVDNDSYGIFDDTAKRLSHHKNLYMLKGNSFNVIPRVVADSADPESGLTINNDTRVGVFIDGPKGKEATRLRSELSKFKNIVCFGYHDYSGQNRIEMGEFKNSLVTHDLDFMAKYSYLNDKVIQAVPKQAKHKNGPGVCVELV
jgi:hypothetical protein